MGALSEYDGALAVRIGDAERDECMNALGEHHARGRLSVAELDQRQTAALSAVTAADLAALLRDLPGHATTPDHLTTPPTAQPPLPKVRASRLLKWAFVPVSFAATGVALASADVRQNDEQHFFAGVAAAGLGYLTHLAVTKWPRSGS